LERWQDGARTDIPARQVQTDHLNDILSPDESWLDIVEDVDGALDEVDARDAVFANLGL
jgi:hypothetical protein